MINVALALYSDTAVRKSECLLEIEQLLHAQQPALAPAHPQTSKREASQRPPREDCKRDCDREADIARTRSAGEYAFLQVLAVQLPWCCSKWLVSVLTKHVPLLDASHLFTRQCQR